MQNVVPSSGLARRSWNVLYGAGLLLLIGLLVAIAGAFLFAVPLVVPTNAAFSAYNTVRTIMIPAGIVVVLLALLLALRAVTWKRDNPLAALTGERLAAFLDARYVFIRNVSRVSLGYVDAVLVGPAGVLVFRITDRTGILFNEGAGWIRQRDRGQWVTMRWNPTRETADDVQRLREWLRVRGLPDVPVFGVIIFTKEMPEAQVTAQNPLVPVVYLSEISYALSDSFFARDRLDAATASKIALLLYG
ncbi:MAG: NERD domain-containing protein [Anaerolineae bacterium]|jgi:hypothetical protein|nr:NERD domain-containing protein [Anaerolineae bacterium]